MKNKEEIISATCLLLSIAKADDVIEINEIQIIKEIIIDFFQLKEDYNIDEIILKSKNKLKESIDIFDFGREVNTSWSYQDKIDFICCTFEVGYSDGHLHYLEEYAIKKIATILNVNHQDLINAKSDLKKYLT